MRVRNFLVAAAVASIAMSALAALAPQYTEWAQGPVQFLMTKDEAAKWKTISSDDEASAFVALFWARRDPTPETPRNEFREEYEKRVATADKQFIEAKEKRGSMTERGKALILYGMPTKIERTGNQRDSSMPQGISDDPASGVAEQDLEKQIWTYEGDVAQKLFNQRRAQIKFVDRYGRTDFQLDRGGADVSAAQRRAIDAAITQPNLTEAPKFAAAAPAPAAMVMPAAPVVQTELATDTLKAAVAGFKAAAKNPYEKQSYATWGEYVTAGGEYFVPVQLYVPKSSGITATDTLTFFGVLQDEQGNNVLAFEEPAKLTASKDDVFVDRSLIGVPADKYRGFFGLASNGTPVTMAATDMKLAGTLDKAAAGVSSLILSNNLYPLSEAQKSDDPYAFGGLKVVPKGDHTFKQTDELWYFFELRNPGIPEAAAAVAPAADAAAAPVAPAPAAAPKVQVKIEVECIAGPCKPKKMTAPPREVEAIEMKGVPGHFGVGNAIPLTSFKLGDYTFNVKVIDTVTKQSYQLTEKFSVVQ